MKNFSIKVLNKEHGKAIQILAFDKGYRWPSVHRAINVRTDCYINFYGSEITWDYIPSNEVKDISYLAELQENEEGWYWIISDKLKLNKYALVYLENNKSPVYGFGYSGDWTNSFHIGNSSGFQKEKATNKEIKDALTKEVKRRKLVKGNTRVKPLDNGENIHWISDCINFKYNNTNDTLSVHNRTIYKNGKWAEIIKSELPEISGYKGQLDGNVIVYGCAKIPVSWFIHTGNRKLSQFTTDSGIHFNSRRVEQIRNYLYENYNK